MERKIFIRKFGPKEAAITKADLVSRLHFLEILSEENENSAIILTFLIDEEHFSNLLKVVHNTIQVDFFDSFPSPEAVWNEIEEKVTENPISMGDLRLAIEKQPKNAAGKKFSQYKASLRQLDKLGYEKQLSTEQLKKIFISPPSFYVSQKAHIAAQKLVYTAVTNNLLHFSST